MKNLSVLMLIILVLLSALPCSDTDDFSVATTSYNQMAHADEEKESCAAICACICCGQSVVQTAITLFQISIPEQKVNHKAIVRNFKLSDTAQNIWQPPQLA